MNIGMMWWNNNPKVPLAAKVLEAAEYYRAKYGQAPDLCLVNLAAYEAEKPESVEGPALKIIIRPLRSILPGHLWIGVDENKK